MRIDHIGYAVRDICQAIKEFRKLGFSFEDIVDDPDRNLYIAFGENGGYRIELVSPRNKGGCSVDHILRREGNTPYHFCYLSEDLEKDMEDLKAARYKVIVPEAPALAFGGRRVVFLMNLNVGLVEIVEV